jgi:hypothetical protein
MAKSTRSKVKRSFRASKRETGIYAATEAARLNRLHAKLSAVASRDIPQDEEEEGAMEDDDELRGWSWFTTFGLLDAEDITAESMGSLVDSPKKQQQQQRQRRRRSRGARRPRKAAAYCSGLKENFVS